ncbi:MAG: glycosyltransferase family 1 protein [Candidatus Sulfotelmatobacter sp.]
MIHLFLNAVAASAGGGLTYVRNVAPLLSTRDDVRATVLLAGGALEEIRESDRVNVVRADWPAAGATLRFWYEQRHLPRLISRSSADVLVSTGNFALFHSPIPQILLSRNALYLSADFFRDLRARGDTRLWLDTEMKSLFARASVMVADSTVAPSAAFAADLAKWTGKNIASIHHGFNHETFFRDQTPLSHDVQTRLAETENSLRILFVSHFNYYRNFETLIRAIAALKEKLKPRIVRLILTCKLDSKDNPGIYRAGAAADLVRQLGLVDEIVELGAIPYGQLHRLYRACDLYVTPAYAETFAHPLLEAMASGLPVIASDLPVHREICGEAALYFPRFSPEILAERVVHTLELPNRLATMQELGLARSRDFSWNKHVDELLRLAQSLAEAS